MIAIKFDEAIRSLVLIMPKMSGYVKKFKVEDKNKKVLFFRTDDEKLLEKYKAIWTKILKKLHSTLYQSMMTDI